MQKKACLFAKQKKINEWDVIIRICCKKVKSGLETIGKLPNVSFEDLEKGRICLFFEISIEREPSPRHHSLLNDAARGYWIESKTQQSYKDEAYFIQKYELWTRNGEPEIQSINKANNTFELLESQINYWRVMRDIRPE